MTAPRIHMRADPESAFSGITYHAVPRPNPHHAPINPQQLKERLQAAAQARLDAFNTHPARTLCGHLTANPEQPHFLLLGSTALNSRIFCAHCAEVTAAMDPTPRDALGNCSLCRTQKTHKQSVLIQPTLFCEIYLCAACSNTTPPPPQENETEQQ